MAVDKGCIWVKNLNGAPGPLVRKAKFAAGSSAPIERGQLLKLSGGNMVPLTADESMSAVVAVSACQIKSGDRAGYYPVYVPRPGDVWRHPLASASDQSLDHGAALYVSAVQELTATAGSNVVGNVVGESQFPAQGFASVDGSPDAGTTIGDAIGGEIHFTIKAATSWYAALQT